MLATFRPGIYEDAQACGAVFYDAFKRIAEQHNFPVDFPQPETAVSLLMTLLSRESVEYRTYSSPYYMGSYSRLVLVYKYYFLDEKGNILEFTGNKNDLLDLMNKKSEEVEKYIKANKLRYDDKYDFAKIVAYYNSLFGT